MKKVMNVKMKVHGVGIYHMHSFHGGYMYTDKYEYMG